MFLEPKFGGMGNKRPYLLTLWRQELGWGLAIYLRIQPFVFGSEMFINKCTNSFNIINNNNNIINNNNGSSNSNNIDNNSSSNSNNT